MFDDFQVSTVPVAETAIFTRRKGSGKPLLLLHGFPETHLMWHRIAPALAERFSVAGHDRGARVAYRLALNHANSVERVAVLDIVPTGEAFARADARLALSYWPWSVLAQPEPLPERLIAGGAAAIVDDALRSWGSDATSFPPAVRAAYIAALRDPWAANVTGHAMAGGHFFPEQNPTETAAELGAFFGS